MPIRVDNSKLRGLMTKQLDKQVNFAISQALNNVAFGVMKSTRSQLPKWVNLTKTYIARQVFVEKATKTQLTSVVYFSDKVPLAGIMELGGVLQPKGRVRAVPTNSVKRSKTGAITKANRPRALLQKKGVFSGTINNKPGIWFKDKKTNRLHLLYSYHNSTSYEPRQFKFLSNAQRRVSRTFDLELEKALDRALATARR